MGIWMFGICDVILAMYEDSQSNSDCCEGCDEAGVLDVAVPDANELPDAELFV